MSADKLPQNILQPHQGVPQGEPHILDLAEVAIAGKDYGKLIEIAAELTIITCQWTYLVEPLLVVANILAKQPQFQDVGSNIHMRLREIYGYAAENSPRGSELEREALECFGKFVGEGGKIPVLHVGGMRAGFRQEEPPDDPAFPSLIAANRFTLKYQAA